jgi:hypothetical protein
MMRCARTLALRVDRGGRHAKASSVTLPPDQLGVPDLSIPHIF